MGNDLKPKLISEKPILDAYFKVIEATLEINGKEFSRLKLNRPDAVAVLIYNEENSSFSFVKQYRHAIAEKNDNEPIIEIAAGLIDEGEVPAEAASREVMEEVGYEVKDLELLYTYFPGVGYCSERIYLFLAIVNEEDKVEEGGGLEIEGELLEPIELSLEEAYNLLDSGEIKDGKTIIALQEFKAKHLNEISNIQQNEIDALEQKVRDLEFKINVLENKPQ